MKQQTLLGATIKRRTINIPPIVKAAVHGEVSNQRYIFNREGQTAWNRQSEDFLTNCQSLFLILKSLVWKLDNESPVFVVILKSLGKSEN